MERPRRSVLRVMRHALEYAAVLGVREVFRYLPPDAAVALGGRIGAFYARSRGPRSGDAAINLGLAFPAWSDTARARVLEASFASCSRDSLATVCGSKGSPSLVEPSRCVTYSFTAAMPCARPWQVISARSMN